MTAEAVFAARLRQWLLLPALVLGLFGLFGLFGQAQAHLMPAQKGTVNLMGTLAYVVLAVPAAAFAGLDENGDGLVDQAELARHQTELKARIRSGFALSQPQPGGEEQALWRDILVSLPDRDERPYAKEASQAPAQSHLLVMAVASFASAPQALLIRSELFAPGDSADLLKLTVTRMDPQGHIVSSDVGLLSPAHPAYLFFAPMPAVLVSFWQLGLEHILTGADHLLFLLALLAAGLRLRRWAWLLSSFTVAHGLSFALAALGYIKLEAAIVEPLIAASIVVTAGLYLAGLRPSLTQELAGVFVVGLIHGLGFAAAMQGQGLHSQRPLLSVLGFNLGVETGQALVALALFATLWLLRRGFGLTDDRGWQRRVAMLSVLMGSYWLLERVANGTILA